MTRKESYQLETRNVAVAYDGKEVIGDVSLSLEPGAIGCLLGPSGCGKTSLLRAIAGFEPVSAGEVLLAGSIVSCVGETLAPEHRNVGMVFQDFALFPHLTVGDNIGFGLRHETAKARTQRVGELLDLVGLSQMADAYPHQLSGGQQQRVALARAMAPRPRILLMDEPFSSIDTELREQLAGEVRDMLLRDGMTAILVTHDQFEAFAMADQIGVFNQGRLLQWDSAYSVYHEPAGRLVADFIGQGAILPARVLDGGRVETELGILSGLEDGFSGVGELVDVLLRPDDVMHDDSSDLKLPVTKKAFRGAEYLYTLRTDSGAEILCLVQSHHDHPIGEAIGIRLEVDHLRAFPRVER